MTGKGIVSEQAVTRERSPSPARRTLQSDIIMPWLGR